MMMQVFVLLLVLHLPMPIDGCAAAVAIVANGVAAFASGVPQIGPYTSVEPYLKGGGAYIDRRCGPLPGPGS